MIQLLKKLIAKLLGHPETKNLIEDTKRFFS
jgi:hypothetical protein